MGTSNANLIEQLFEHGIIKTEAVANAMKAVDRAKYCKTGFPYQDAPQRIGFSGKRPFENYFKLFFTSIPVIFSNDLSSTYACPRIRNS